MKTELDKYDLNLMTLAQQYSDEGKARELLESLRWPNGAICPHCKCDDVYKLTPKPQPAPRAGAPKPRKVREGLYKHISGFEARSHYFIQLTFVLVQYVKYISMTRPFWVINGRNWRSFYTLLTIKNFSRAL
jgi:hypothetical protein